ncbi:MAG: hypothetical protein ACJ74O_16550 [Frankiaceae bacterium]
MANQPILFISHKHSDAPIADVVRRFVEDRSGGRIEVFQSSSNLVEGPRLGRNLNQELCSRLWQAGLLILIYTSPDENWDYCMWECGVATRPDSPETRVIVFQCGKRPPKVFEDQVRVDVRIARDVQRFVTELLTDPTFMPGLQQPLTRFNKDSPNVQEAGIYFFDELLKVRPVEESGDDAYQWPPYPYLRLEISVADAELIRDAEGAEQAEVALRTVRSAKVADMDSEARRLFGVAAVRPGLLMDALEGSWQRQYATAEPDWLHAIADQVRPAVLDQFPRLSWSLMRSVDANDRWWYAPVINRVHQTGGRFDFDVYFDKFELDDDGKHVAVHIPAH